MGFYRIVSKTMCLFAKRLIAVTEPTNHIIFRNDILLVSIELHKKHPAFVKKLKSGDTFEINHENQFQSSDTAH